LLNLDCKTRSWLLLNFGCNLHAALPYLYNYAPYIHLLLLEVQKYCTVSRNRWIAVSYHCNIYSLGATKVLLYSPGLYGTCRLRRNMQYYRILKELEDDYLMSSIRVFNSHCSRCSACVAYLSSTQQY